MLRTFVVIYSVVFLAVAALGLAQHGMSQHPGALLGVFPINGLHNLAHLAIGLAGLLAAAVGAGACRLYGKVVGTVYIALAVLGLVSPSGFGLMPIGGADVPLHLAAGVAALYIGFSRSVVHATA